MATCFLFAQSLGDENGLSLCLDDNACVSAPLELRTLDEIKALQRHAKTIVVLPTECSSIHTVELAWVSERKARAVLPYALEEQLAQPVENLHFAFDRRRYAQGQYLVVVIDKSVLTDVMARLNRLHLAYDCITLDWFALHAGEACVSETSLLVYDQSFKGALSLDLAPLYENKATAPVFLFNDSPPLPHVSAYTSVDAVSYRWIAERLVYANPLNLCQGALSHDTSQLRSVRWYQASALVALVGLLSTLVMHALMLHRITSDTADVDQRISVIYHAFFPTSTQVISPKFRVTQLMHESLASHDAVLWHLLDIVSKASTQHPVTLLSMHFQNQSITLSVACPDFRALEALEHSLQKAHAKVVQTEAATRKTQVVATLILTLGAPS